MELVICCLFSNPKKLFIYRPKKNWPALSLLVFFKSLHASLSLLGSLVVIW